jgi:uncharacterized protein with HEPN domain
MKKDELRAPDFLAHILQAIERISTYTDDMDEVGFLENEMVQDAVIRNIEIIGEAARNIEKHHPEFASEHPNVPWEDMYWMRNRVSHGYFSVDLEVIWNTIQRDIPELEQQAKDILDQLINQSSSQIKP